MRSSNSRDKPSTSSHTQNRLMKTQVPPKSQTQKDTLNNTQYRLPPSNKRIESSKSSSTKPMPKQQLHFDIDSHMTESKIYTAKQSLQLLKKKMNRTGMSRQKPSSNTNPMQKTSYTTTSMKKVTSEKQKNIENYQPQYEQKNYQPQYQPKNYKIQSQTQHQPGQVPKRQMMTRQNKPKQQPFQQNNLKNQKEQIPLGPKQDFYALLEKQMEKQQNQPNKSNLNNNQYDSFSKANQNNQVGMPSEYGQDVQLVQCRKGCGRMFNPQVLIKHEKVCEKVFQSKRKVFNTAAQRQLEEGLQTTQKPLKKGPQKKKQPQKKKIPKWKIESAQFRAGLKAMNNQPLTKQQEQIQNMEKDSLVPCHVCGRRFNQKAAQRHIPVCENKAKMMPRGSNIRKK